MASAAFQSGYQFIICVYTEKTSQRFAKSFTGRGYYTGDQSFNSLRTFTR